MQSGRLTYKESGVDITAGNNLIDYIKPLSKSTKRAGVLGSLGGFGGLFDTKTAGYQDPLLVSGTDGVGTKLKVIIDTKKRSADFLLDYEYYSGIGNTDDVPLTPP